MIRIGWASIFEVGRVSRSHKTLIPELPRARFINRPGFRIFAFRPLYTFAKGLSFVCRLLYSALHSAFFPVGPGRRRITGSMSFRAPSSRYNSKQAVLTVFSMFCKFSNAREDGLRSFRLSHASQILLFGLLVMVLPFGKSWPKKAAVRLRHVPPKRFLRGLASIFSRNAIPGA